ncbi:MAG: hypothetical protein LH609_12665 [Rudanella sp.]|nr:hypothetical protein [Rudanella sp.]
MDSKKVHQLSGIVLSGFIGIHLANHVYGLFGADKHIELMNMLRLFYRNRFIETVLLLAVFSQIITGLTLFSKKRKVPLSGFGKIQLGSGLYLAIFLVVHVSAVFAGRLVLHLDTNFYFGAAGLNTFPLNLFFVPYYALAILSVFGHVATVHAQKMTRSIGGISPRNQAKWILTVGLILTMVIFYGLTNEFAGVEIPKEYDVMTGK